MVISTHIFFQTAHTSRGRGGHREGAGRAPDVDRNGPAGHHLPQARASSRLGALQPIMRAELRREAAIAYDQVRRVGRTGPHMKAVRVAATGVRADGTVHEDVAGGDDLGRDDGGGTVTHGRRLI